MIRKGSIAFIVGAGISRCAGAPMMTDFFDKMKRLHRRRVLDLSEDAFIEINQSIRNELLASCNIKSHIDTDNIETVLNTIEIISLIDGVKNSRFEFSAERAERASQYLKIAIKETIESSIIYKKDDRNDGVFSPHPAFMNFASILETFRNRANISVVSFNYDILLEYALHLNNCKYSYGFGEEKGNYNRINLFKLHGSFNWAQNKLTKSLAVAHVDKKLIEDDVARLRTNRSLVDSVSVKFSNQDFNLSEEEVNFPFIVPPSHNKLHSQLELKQVWSKAANALNEAELIFVIGYSLPESDSFFRDFFALSTFGPSEFENIFVVNPDETAFQRVQSLLSPNELRRNRAKHIQGGFEDSLEAVYEVMDEYCPR